MSFLRGFTEDKEVIPLFKMATLGALFLQSAWGLVSLIYTLTQSTSPSASRSVFDPQETLISFSVLQGVMWSFLVIFFMVKRPQLSGIQDAVMSYFLFFTASFFMMVGWTGRWLHHNKHNNHAPIPGEDLFMPYFSNQLVNIVVSVIHCLYAWDVINAEPTMQIMKQARDENTNYNWRLAMQVFGAAGCIVFVGDGFWLYFFIAGYNMGAILYHEVFFFIGSGLLIGNFICYFKLKFVNDRKDTSGAFYVGSWKQIDRVQFFLFSTWAYNFAFWIKMWTDDWNSIKHQADFNMIPDNYYTLEGNGIINSILLPLYAGAAVTLICHSNYMYSTVDRSLFYLGLQSLFEASVLPAVLVARAVDKKSVLYKATPPSVLMAVFKLLMSLSFMYSIIAAIITLYDLTQHNFLANNFLEWRDSEFAIDIVIWGIYTIYVVATVFRSAYDDFYSTRNALNMCTYSRPWLMFTFSIFLSSYYYGAVFHRYHSNGNIMTGQNDGTTRENTIYWAMLTVTFGLIIPKVMAYKDIFNSIYGTAVLTNADKVMAKELSEVANIPGNAITSMTERA